MGMTDDAGSAISSQKAMLTSWGIPLLPVACGCSDGYWA